MIGTIALIEEPLDGLRAYLDLIAYTKAAEQTEKGILVIGASSGTVEASYRIGKMLAELNHSIVVVSDKAATMHSIKPHRANPVIKQVEAGPQQSGKVARRLRRAQERKRR